MRLARALAIAVPVLLCTGAAIWLFEAERAEMERRAEYAELEPERAEEEVGAPHPAATHARTSATEEVVDTTRAAEPSAATRRFAGRCVDERGVAVPAAYVALATQPDGRVLTTVRSDATGQVELEGPATDDPALTICASCPGHVNQGQSLREFLARQDPLAFVLVLPRGERLAGRVVDSLERPIAGVRVHVAGRSTETLVTSSDGRFALPSALPSGRYRLVLEAEDHLTGYPLIELPQAEAEPQYVLRPQRKIRGFARDAAGAGIADVQICGHTAAARAQAATREDGSFELKELSFDGDEIVLEALAGVTEAWKSEAPVPWGSEGVLLVLERAAVLRVRVVAADTREPVERYGVHVFTPGQAAQAHTWLARGAHPDGRAKVAPVRRGTWHLRVAPDDRRFAPSPIQEIEIGSGTSLELEVELERRAGLVVLVRDDRDRALSGARVELVLPGPDVRATWWRDSVLDVTGLLRAQHGQLVQIDAVDTDEHGVAELRFVRERPPAAVRVAHPDFAPAFLAGEFAPESRHEIRLDPPARAEFTLEPPVVRSIEVVAELEPVGEMTHAVTIPCLRLRAFEDGRVVFDGLPAGEYQLRLAFANARIARESERFRLARGERREQVIDLSALVPAQLDVRIQRADGAPFRASLRCFRKVGGSFTPCPSIDLDKDGEARDVWILPGEYRFAVEVLQLNGGRNHLPGAAIEIGTREFLPGQRALLEYSVGSRSLELRVKAPDARRRASPFVELSVADVRVWRPLDEQGRAVFDPAPNGPFTLRIADVLYPERGAFEPPAGDANWTLDVELR